MQQIYDGPEVHVLADLDRGGRELVVSFSPRSDRPHSAGFGAKLFSARDIPAIYVISKRNHWWQVADMTPALAAIDALKLHARYDAITTYGTSMGGHGALIFSGPLHATRVLAFSPQFAIHGRSTPWPSRWAEDVKGLQEQYPIERYMSRSAEILTPYDPATRFDVQHIRAIAAVRDIIRVPLPFAGHGTPAILSSLGLLSGFVVDVISGKHSIGTIRQEVRAGRRHIPLYWMGLQAKTAGTRKALSEIARSRAIEAAIASLDVGRSRDGGSVLRVLPWYCADLMSSGHADRAVSLAEKTIAIYSAAPAARLILSDIRHRLGDIDGAVLEAKRALKLQRDNLDTRQRLIVLLLEKGNLQEAGVHIERALSTPGKGGKLSLRIHARISPETVGPRLFSRVQSMAEYWRSHMVPSEGEPDGNLSTPQPSPGDLIEVPHELQNIGVA